VSLAAACSGKASHFHLNDINKPLMELWREIIHHPERISKNYNTLWNEQVGREREFYDFIRDKFNRTKKPEYLLYLLARCVKGAVRYNAKGEFNQSPDNRRRGRHPKAMKDDLFIASSLLRGRTIITNEDYQEVLNSVSKTELVYMDPPYQGVCGNRDPRYYTGVDFEELLQQLEGLVKRQIPFILSYDGRRGQRRYGKEVPTEIGLYRVEVRVGRSAQSTLLGGSEITYESIYLSNELINRLDMSPEDLVGKLDINRATQLSLFAKSN